MDMLQNIHLWAKEYVLQDFHMIETLENQMRQAGIRNIFMVPADIDKSYFHNLQHFFEISIYFPV